LFSSCSRDARRGKKADSAEDFAEET